jgi:hypothetical protein
VHILLCNLQITIISEEGTKSEINKGSKKCIFAWLMYKSVSY